MAEIEVTTSADELDGASGNDECSLREAIMNANLNNGNQVDCDPGTTGTDIIKLRRANYTLTRVGANEDGNSTGDIDITDSLIIEGHATAPTVIQAGTSSPGIDRVLDIQSGVSVTINHVTIQNGKAPDGGAGLDGDLGGGIYNRGNLTLNDCIVRDNQAGNGGDASSYDGGWGGAGGGIFNFMDSTLTLNRTQVLNNRAGDGGIGSPGFIGGSGGNGGGIYSGSNTAVSLTDSEIADNESGNGGNGGNGTSGNAERGGGGGYGGGIYCLQCSSFRMNLIKVLGNSTGSGGDGGNVTSGIGDGGNGGNGGIGAGLYIHGTDFYVDDSTIGENTTGFGGDGGLGLGGGLDGAQGYRGSGGGIALTNSSVGDFKTSTIYNNSAMSGGGIHNDSTSAIVALNITISGNTADESGGGIYHNGLIVNFSHVTIARNIANFDSTIAGKGGGFHNQSSTTFNFKNSIIAENDDYGATKDDPDCSGVATSLGFNILGVGSSTNCSFAGIGTDKIGSIAFPADPSLASLSDNGGPTLTHSFKTISIACDQMTYGTSGCFTDYKYDQRGVIRFAPCDIGAYELDQATHIFLPLILR